MIKAEQTQGEPLGEVGRATVIASNIPRMSLWREKCFALLTRNAAAAGDYFLLPPKQMVELGTRVEF